LFIQVDPWGNIEVLDEIYKSGLTPDEFADEIIERLGGRDGRVIFLDGRGGWRRVHGLMRSHGCLRGDLGHPL